MFDVTLDPRPSTPSPTLLGSYAHLRREENLLVTGWQRLSDQDFALTVRWPLVPRALPYDPRILAQTVRQTGLVVAHAAYDVPLTHQTVLSTLSFTLAPGLRIPGGHASAPDVRITVTEGGGRRATRALRMSFTVLLDGGELARAEAEFAWISERAYDRVRGARRQVGWGTWAVPAPVDARLVFRPSPADVMLSPGDRPHRWLLRNDPGNHLLFDHPVDHVPGLALLDAADQAARALLAPVLLRPAGVEAVYRRYVELDQPCHIEAVPLAEPGSVRVTGTQRGETAFSVDFRAGG